jgi:hypothetical protein
LDVIWQSRRLAQVNKTIDNLILTILLTAVIVVIGVTEDVSKSNKEIIGKDCQSQTSILLAVLTASPQRSKVVLVSPISPAKTGPVLIPILTLNLWLEVLLNSCKEFCISIA